jgi:enoyl-CoA hydratase/carnithine racemase
VSYETVIWEESGGVGRLTLNRPETLNAWTAQFGAELGRVIAGEAAADSVRAVLVTGAGRGSGSAVRWRLPVTSCWRPSRRSSASRSSTSG